MARLFTTDHGNLDNGFSPDSSTTEYTTYCKFKARSGQVGTLIGKRFASTTFQHQLFLSTSGVIDGFFGDNLGFSELTGPYDDDVWHNGFGINFDDAATKKGKVRVDGTEDATPVTSGTDTNTNAWLAGARWQTGSTYAFQVSDTDIAEYTVWNGVLTEPQLTAIENGVPPFVIRNDIIEYYVPMWGNLSPEPQQSGQNVTTMTMTGTARADHPPMELLENYL